MSLSLFSSFIFLSNPFLSRIDKSALGLGVSVGLKPSYVFAISFSSLLSWTVLLASKSFPERSYIILYFFNESSKYSNISSVHWNFSLFSISISASHPDFFFLLGGTIKFCLSTKISVFSQDAACYFLLLTRMCTCKKITPAKRVISPGAFLWGERRDSPPRQY